MTNVKVKKTAGRGENLGLVSRAMAKITKGQGPLDSHLVILDKCLLFLGGPLFFYNAGAQQRASHW